MEPILEKGLKFFVFRWELWQQVPRLPWLCQAGANKTMEAHRKPAQSQALMSMQNDVSDSMTGGRQGVVDRKEVMRHAGKDSEFVEMFPSMLDWICAYGGGQSGIWTKELCTFTGECCGTGPAPVIKGDVFKEIAQWKTKAANRCANSSVAVLKLAAKRQQLKVSGADARKIGELKELEAIDRILKDGRTLCLESHGGYRIAHAD